MKNIQLCLEIYFVFMRGPYRAKFSRFASIKRVVFYLTNLR